MIAGRSYALQPPSTGVCRVPHVSLTDRPCLWSCMDQETAVFELELASIPRLRRVQKQRAQFFKVRARSVIERMPSLAHGACTRAHTGLASGRQVRPCT